MKRYLLLLAIPLFCSMASAQDERTDLSHIKEVLVQIDSALVQTIPQEAFDNARETWNTFKALCIQDKFEKALDYYEGERADGYPRTADFLIYLKHSTYRYYFYSEVLYPLLFEYRESEEALDRIISILELEMAMEEASMDMSDNGYIPEVYPYVVRDLRKAKALRR